MADSEHGTPTYGSIRRPARPILVLVLALLSLPLSSRALAQAPSGEIDSLVVQLQRALTEGDETTLRSLFDEDVPDPVRRQYSAEMMAAGASRHVLRELDRTTLPESGDGSARLFMELFHEWPGHARLVTLGLALRRAAAGAWRILAVERLGSVEGLYRLRLDGTTQYTAVNLVISAPDLQLTMNEGTVFVLDSDDGPSGLVLLGRGEMRFSPAPESERGQLRLYADAEALVAPFESALVRLSPSDYPQQVPSGALRRVAMNRDLFRRATDVVERELPKALTVDLREVSPDPWHLLPREGDFLADVRTRSHGTLTYSRFGAQAEDVSLINRDRGLTIALYSSAARLASRGRSYSDEAQREYDVLDYAIDASVTPARRFIRATARISVRTLAPLSTLGLRLSNVLTVTRVASVEHGALSHFRVRNQNTVVVRLPGVIAEGGSLTLLVTYSGLVTSESLENEALQLTQAGPDPPLAIDPEPHLLLSAASYWYPQNPHTDYATATLRVAVPREYTCIGSGEVVANGTDSAAGVPIPDGNRIFTFRAGLPLRYLAIIVSRFNNIYRQPPAGETLAEPPSGLPASLSVEVNPLQRARGREFVDSFRDVLRFYSTTIGDVPFPSATLALVEAGLPGGHSPGYFVVLNVPTFGTLVTWRNDPAAFQGFPEFFLAHEVAHQWWGQAVGMANYHERWISEGFAQYFAALYAQHARGDGVFHDMLRQFRRWSLAESEMGPVYLGHRLGQIEGGPRVFRALVYNKGAAVLHMLRRVVGDEAFFNALRRFYQAHRFGTAGTEDLRAAFESETGRPFDRFFDQWIYGSDLPEVQAGYEIVNGEATVRLQQTAATWFELPVTVTLSYEDGTTSDVVVVMQGERLEQTIDTDRRVRGVQFNRDSAALAEFDD